MDLSLTETQQLVKQTVEDFIEREAPISTLIELQQSERGFSEGIWRTAGDLGWLGMLVSEEYGGSNSELTDVAVLFEALGRGAVPGPFLSQAIAAELIGDLGSDEQKAAYLPKLATGEAIFAFAMGEPEYRWGPGGVQMRPRSDGSDLVLHGTKAFTYDAHAADYILTVVRTGDDEDDLSLLIVDARDAGITARHLAGFTSSEAEVSYSDVRVPAGAMLGELNGAMGAINRMLTRVTPLLCAYQVGGAQAVFDMSVQYSRDRVQFGRPIGRFQFVQNHIVQLVINLDSARWTTYEALWKIDTGQDAQAAVHLAKAVTSDGYRKAADYAHEVHAGTGVMREYGLTLYTRLSRSLFHALGEPRYHRKQLAQIIPTMEIPDE